MTAITDPAIAELQRTIAELTRERDAALLRLDRDNDERIAHQAATIDVLQAMSASPGDPQPVFDLIVRQAHELCDSPGAMLGEFDGELLHLRSILDVNADPEALEIYKRRFPMAPTEGPQTSLYLEGRELHIRDGDTDADLPAAARVTGIRSWAGVPFRRDGKVIGAVVLSKSEPGGYSDSQIELLRTFAEQAVIAITSAETYRSLQARTADLQEALEQQTATAEILQVINASPGDLAPVFETILAKAHTLCGAELGSLGLFDGQYFRKVARYGYEGTADELLSQPYLPRGSHEPFFRGETLHVPDVMDPGWEWRTAVSDDFFTSSGLRAWLEVPLWKDGTLLGTISGWRREPRPFSDKEIRLLESFAAQAVIAMENARLLGQLRERTAELAERNTAFAEQIDHQAATIDVLRSISASPDDARPALETIARRAWALCGEQSAIVYRVDGSMIHLVAYHRPNLTAEQHQEVQSFWPRPIAESIMAPAVTERRILHVRDVDAWPRATDRARRFWKSAIWVPMLRGDAVIGIIGIDSQEKGGFSDTQVELLKTFAEQAVIAITSAETYRALQTRTAELAERNTSFAEQIDHQAATIDVLKAMSASPGDARPALEMIARRAWALCGEQSAIVYSVDGPMMDLVLYHRPNLTTELARDLRSRFPSPVERHIMAPAITERRVLHIRDIDTYTWPGANDVARRFFRSAIWVPMLRGDTVIGLIGIDSREKGGFSDTQVELLKTFAEQAVIAITSAETYSALQTRTADLQTSLEYQTATSDVLAVISRSTANVQPVLDTLVETAARLCGANDATIAIREGEVYRFVAACQAVAADRERWASIRQRTIIPGRDTVSARVLLEGDVVRIADILADPEFALPETVERGNRTMLGVPLLRDGDPIGVIALAWRHVEPYSQRQIELIRTFADQAVIAMENARLLNEQREALDRQTATAEVLEVINSSPGDLTPVFDAVLEKALRLCGASIGGIYSYNGRQFEPTAFRGITPEFAAFDPGRPLTPFPGGILDTILHTRCPVQDPDLMDTDRYRNHNPYTRALVDLGGIRALLDVPLLKDGDVSGVITIFRRQPGAFTEKQIALLENFAAQAVIAMENARLLTEQKEALEQQTATAEVLGVINASPGDLTPVFEAILEKAHRICHFDHGALALFDGTHFRDVATRGYGELGDAWSRDPYLPSGAQRLVLHGAPYGHIPDISVFTADPDDTKFTGFVALTGFRATLLVPLRKDGAVIGHISGWRLEPGPFSDKDIALLKNFAAQAVIAIDNARLLTEQREALERQTAITEVLAAINASPGDLTPVFETILHKALRSCGATIGNLFGFHDDRVRLLASVGLSEEARSIRRDFLLPGPGHPMRRIRDEKRPVQVSDVADEAFARIDPDWRRTYVEISNVRAFLNVPLLRDGEAIGLITILRREPGVFPDQQVALLENFAAQAVIAMENARLLTEQREALEQQTATAEVLQVINASPGDLTPVFEAMLDKAMRLCGVAFGMLRGYDGERVHELASRGLPRPFADFLAGWSGTRIRGATAMARALKECIPVQEVDIREEEGYKNGSAGMRAIVELAGGRTVLHVPLVKDRISIGFFTFFRQEVRAFSDKEIALLENFAAQAVIAMENARLLNEQREALERQIAMADVLRIINENPGKLNPVFDAVMELSLRLVGAAFGALYTYDGERFHMAAIKGVPPEFEDYRRRHPQPLGADSPPGQLLATKRPVQVVDNMTHPFFVANPDERDAQINLGGVRAVLALPLLQDGAVVGQLVIYRKDPGVFPDKQVALLESFAAQAVIAMENARLLNEQREALERQTATAEVLGVINASPGDLVPVFDAIVEKAHDLCGAAFGGLLTYDGESTLLQAHRNLPPAWVEWLAAHNRIGPGSPMHRLVQGEPLFQVEDLQKVAETTNDHRARAGVELGGIRTLLLIPLRKDGVLLGIITAYRREVRLFSAKQIALLENFAAQAVIAMENARLLTETREALEQQTATAEVLQVINESPGDLGPVFDAILNKAHTLCGAAIGSLYTWDGEFVRAVATHGFPEDYAAFARQNHPPNFMIRPLIEGARYHHVPDVKALETRDRHASSIMEQTDARTILMIPLRKDGAFAGFITAVRTEVRPFVEKEIALLENFAAQAVIAMDNARLLTELRESLEQQTAMADVLRVINLNPGDVRPVFDAILARAHRIGKADRGALALYDDGVFRVQSTFGYSPETEAYLRAGVPTGPIYEPLFRGERVYIPDRENAAMPESGLADWLDSASREELFDYLRRAEISTYLLVPLYKDGTLLGLISANRHEARPFSEKEIALLENFAAQAVIAVDNARLLNEIRQRQVELDITFENMGDGVAMFDDEQKLAAWNRNFQDILDLPDDAVRVGLPFADYIRGLAERGEYGADADTDEQIARLTALLDQANRFERTRPNGHVIDVRQNPIPGGGFVVIYADITERKRAEEALRAARDEAETALRELKLAQANLVQAEKMASLGQLTAGIAHEIKNPLNFVNNFASLSVELLDELKEAAAPALATLDGDARADVEDLTETLTGNLKKIEEHGKRADGIVHSMLEHSRGSSAERRAVDINDLVDEALNLAYHGARAQDQSFNITLERDLAPGIAPVTLAPQDMTRVLLNLIGNGFYAARKRRETGAADFEPTLKVATRDLGDAVEFRVRDNGIGIPPDIRDKLFQPFFTTKPTGEGTGLGLSITWDVVTKAHAGTITVDSEPGDHTEFTVTLPRHAAERARP